MIRNILKRRILSAITAFQKVYYSDATYSIVIGEFTRNCDGSSSSWGSTSTYKIINLIECGG